MAFENETESIEFNIKNIILSLYSIILKVLCSFVMLYIVWGWGQCKRFNELYGVRVDQKVPILVLCNYNVLILVLCNYNVLILVFCNYNVLILVLCNYNVLILVLCN